MKTNRVGVSENYVDLKRRTDIISGTVSHKNLET
jgi:hypothetical protein